MRGFTRRFDHDDDGPITPSAMQCRTGCVELVTEHEDEISGHVNFARGRRKRHNRRCCETGA
jgi:hypothetical protein